MRLDVNKTSFLSMNNFANNYFGQKKPKQNVLFLEILEDYNGFCLKKFQQKQQKPENTFLAKFSFWRIS